MVKKEVAIHEKVGISDSVRVRARTDMTDIYIKEAERQAKRARVAFDNSLISGEEIGCDLWNEKQASLFTILLSVFSLEAHINRIGHDNLEEDEFEKRERNRLNDKWIEFPELITDEPFKLSNGETFKSDTDLFKNFQEIIDLRNTLVHFKEYGFKELVKHPCGVDVPGIYETINVKNAELAYSTASDMIEELDRFLKEKS